MHMDDLITHLPTDLFKDEQCNRRGRKNDTRAREKKFMKKKIIAEPYY